MDRSELIIDSFAGGGGASLGIAWALGRAPDIAINHDAAAIAMHAANHPSTEHVLEDVWKTDLRKLTKGRDVGLLWASPDCKHFSRAKGGKPVEKKIRSLAWIVCKWADQIRPRMIALENVREFADWGPLVPRWNCRECDWCGTEGQARLIRVLRRCPRCDAKRLQVSDDLIPDPSRKGVTCRKFIGRLKSLGYQVDWRNLDAADYGAPTHRKRLFLVARCDGDSIHWPEPTHASPKKLDAMPLFGRLKPYRTAAECVDWSIPCPSIFDRKRPLAEKTMRRIALGIKRYVLENEKPFIVPVGYGERDGQDPRTSDIDEPLGTVVGNQKHAVVAPILSKYHHSKTENDDRCQQLNLPFSTLDTQPRFALIAPILTTVNHGDSGGETGRSKAVDESPLPTQTGKGHQALVAVFLAKHFGGMVGVPLDTPLPTTTMRGTQNQIVAANLIHLNHGEKQWSSVEVPLRTQTASGNHAALVYSFLIRYFGTSIGANVIEPLPTSTTKDRCGLVYVTIDGEPYMIVDIGMRMLTPRELATAQGFPLTYILTGTKTSQVARIGNSVCPQVPAAIVKANCTAEVGIAL